MNLFDVYPIFLLALCVWREAQNQSYAAQVAVACSVRNRVKKPCWWGKDYVSVILCHEQYSSFNRNDPNATKFALNRLDPSWEQALQIANDVYSNHRSDTTNGATHYYDKSLDSNPPAWATDGKMVEVAVFDELRFWKTKENPS